MTTSELQTMFQEALKSLRQLRAQAGYPETDLEEEPQLRAEARRFAHRLACAPDADSAEIELLADRSGAQAFWGLLLAHRETVELLLQPAAFELLPLPLPYEVLCLCLLSMLDTEPPVKLPAEGAAVETPQGTFDEPAATGSDALRLSPRVGEGHAGAVWEFKDVY